MCRIREVDESNKQWIIDHLKRDVVRHVFAFYDLQQDPETQQCMPPSVMTD